MARQKIDINVDMGESFGMYKLGSDEEIMQFCTSANVACGFHASDPHVMRHTVEMAKQHGVAVGVHFGLPDLVGFGRRIMVITPEQLKDYVIYQIGALKGFTDAAKVKLQHVKPHGALYLMLRNDEELSKAVVEAVQEIDDSLILFSWRNSAIYEVAKKKGLRVVNEFYADRACEEDEKIVFQFDLNNIGGSIEKAVERTMKFIQEGEVIAFSGKKMKVEADTICVHGDSPIALDLASALYQAFQKAGVEIQPVGNFLS